MCLYISLLRYLLSLRLELQCIATLGSRNISRNLGATLKIDILYFCCRNIFISFFQSLSVFLAKSFFQSHSWNVKSLALYQSLSFKIFQSLYFKIRLSKSPFQILSFKIFFESFSFKVFVANSFKVFLAKSLSIYESLSFKVFLSKSLLQIVSFKSFLKSHCLFIKVSLSKTFFQNLFFKDCL